MKMIPVLDILGGVAVRAQGGVRNEYQPLQSLGCANSDPVHIANSIQAKFGFHDWYIADLDGIVHRQWNYNLIHELAEQGFSLRVDLGIESIEDLCLHGELMEKTRFILASEAIADCSALDSLTCMVDPLKLTFSLDLIDGEMICPENAWGECSAIEVIDYVAQRGLREIIVLDLAYIGCTKGVGTLEICKQIKQSFPELEILSGGGVRTKSQISQLEQTGIHAVLLGTALHNGQLNPEDLICYQN